MRDPRLATLFPDEVITVVATPEMYLGPVRDEEARYLAPMRHKRRREFTAGRVAARIALGALGITDHPLTRDDDRVPRWPHGIVGSLTHCDGFCAVAAANREHVAALGLDCEIARPLSPELAAQVGTEAELSAAGARVEPSSLGAVLVFSAKESFYKAWFPDTRRPLGFHEVEVVFEEGQAHGFLVRVPDELARLWDHGTTVAGRYTLFDGIVCAGVALRA